MPPTLRQLKKPKPKDEWKSRQDRLIGQVFANEKIDKDPFKLRGESKVLIADVFDIRHESMKWRGDDNSTSLKQARWAKMKEKKTKEKEVANLSFLMPNNDRRWIDMTEE